MKSLLILKLGAIGDTVMALAGLEALRREQPELKVTWIAGSTVAPLIESSGLVDRLIVLDEAKAAGKRGVVAGIGQWLKAWRFLGFRSFSRRVVAYRDWRYLLVLGPAHACWAVRQVGEWAPTAGRYHGDEYCRLFSGSNAVWTGATDPLNVPGSSKWKKREGQVVVLFPGGAKNAHSEEFLRRAPIALYVGISKRLQKEGFRVKVWGGPGDQWVADHFSPSDQLEVEIGSFTLEQLIQQLSEVSCLISHDTGPIHLAYWTGTPTVALFGPTIPDEKVPHRERARVIWGGAHLACRPCYTGTRYAKCPSPRCLEKIEVESVVRLVTQSATS